MTAEELIIEHFEGTLSLEQEGELTQVLAASPEARAMYDRYLKVDDVLAGDVAATAPSSTLDERVLAAALGAIGGTIGGGSAAWLGGLTGKVAAVVSVIAVGGISILLFGNDNDRPAPVVPATAPASSTPAVRSTPSITPPAAEPSVPAEVKSSSDGQPAVAPAPRRSTAAGSTDVRNTRRATVTRRGGTTTKPTLDLGKEPETTIKHPTKVGK
jgi:hypothetical protein